MDKQKSLIMGYSSAIKRCLLKINVTTWMNLGNMLNETF